MALTIQTAEPVKTINEAADMINALAEELRISHSLQGEWVIVDDADQNAKEEYGRMIKLVERLRQIKGDSLPIT